MKKYYIECDCLCLEHTIRLMYDEEDNHDNNNELYIDYCLKPYLPFHKKLWNCLKYLFGDYSSVFWAETVISKKETKKLIKYLKNFVKNSTIKGKLKKKITKIQLQNKTI